jgi:type I restriction enzyme S subunit
MTVSALLAVDNARLPEGWTLRPLSEFCTEIFERCGDKHLPVMSVSKNHGIIPQSERFKKRIASEDVRNYKVIKPGFFAYDPMLLWSGSISQHKRQEVGIVSPAYCVFGVSDTLNPKFLLYFLNAPQRLPFYESISFGTNARRRKAQFNDFCKLQIPYPPVSEQERIVRILDEADELRRLRAQADHCTADLIPAIFHKMFDDPATNPKGWDVVALNKVISITSGHGFDKSEYSESGVRLLQIANVTFQKISWETASYLPTSYLEKFPKLVLKSGDLLMALNRPILGRNIKFALLSESDCPAILYQRVGKIVIESEKLNQTYFYGLMHSDYFYYQLKSRLSGSDQPYINPTALITMHIPVPPLSLQRQFAACVMEVRKLEESQAASRERLNDLFQSLLHRAFTGEL